MKRKLSLISSFLGASKNRYMTYREEPGLEEKIRSAAGIEGLEGLELCWPADFADPATTRKLMADSGLEVSAINFRSRRTGQWLRGSFSSASSEERAQVVDDLRRAMDMSKELGCSIVSTCPLNDGSDSLFEIDYTKAWTNFAESLAKAASHDPTVRIALEYKMNDPRVRCLVGNAGETLALCMKSGAPNVGVTLDIGHSLQAGERPAQAAALLAAENRLFSVHLNDNDRFWDWDMIPGSFNPWEAVELFYYLDRLDYTGWLTFDVFTKEMGIKETYDVSIGITRKIEEWTARLDERKLSELFLLRNPARSLSYLYSIL